MVDKPENTDSRTVMNYGTEIAGGRHEDLPDTMKIFWILIGVLVTCLCIHVIILNILLTASAFLSV